MILQTSKQIINSNKFLQKALAKFSDHFEYFLMDYKGGNTPIEVICKEHGNFWVKPNNHLRFNGGCVECAKKSQSAKVSYSIEHWTKLLAEKTTTVKIKYYEEVRGSSKLTIDCEYHGESETTFHNMIKHKHACKYCAYHENSWSHRTKRVDTGGKVYHVYFPPLKLWKIGVTHSTLGRRFPSNKYPPFEVVWSITLPTLKAAYALELELFRQHKTLRYRGTDKPILGGSTELLYLPINKPKGF